MNWDDVINAAISTEERFMGSLIGLAVGDALGLTVELRKPGTFDSLTDIVGGGRFKLQPGEWTDDTSMALCLGQSLLDCNGFNAEDQIKKYVQWHDNGCMSCTGRCFDIGNTVNRALKLYLSSGNPISGGRETFSAGNGSLMRLAPVAMYFFRTVEDGIHYCGESSRTTHG